MAQYQYNSLTGWAIKDVVFLNTLLCEHKNMSKLHRHGPVARVPSHFGPSQTLDSMKLEIKAVADLWCGLFFFSYQLSLNISLVDFHPLQNHYKYPDLITMCNQAERNGNWTRTNLSHWNWKKKTLKRWLHDFTAKFLIRLIRISKSI